MEVQRLIAYRLLHSISKWYPAISDLMWRIFMFLKHLFHRQFYNATLRVCLKLRTPFGFVCCNPFIFQQWDIGLVPLPIMHPALLLTEFYSKTDPEVFPRRKTSCIRQLLIEGTAHLLSGTYSTFPIL